MARPLREVTQLCDRHACPLVVAGDLFDRWNPPPELINWVMDRLPHPTFAVPGQHDLPHHRYEDVGRSGYWTLVKAGRITDLGMAGPLWTTDAVYHGFPWGVPATPCPPRHELDGRLHVAVVHAYVWTKGHSHPGAARESRFRYWLSRLEGYDAAVFGDNHSGFLIDAIKPTFNCGTLMRRKIDERPYRPMVGLLSQDGTVTPHYLDCSEDKFITAETLAAKGLDLDARPFLEELRQLGDTTLDFREAVMRALNRWEVKAGTRRAVLRILEGES